MLQKVWGVVTWQGNNPDRQGKGKPSTVEEDLMDAAEDSSDWDKDGADKVLHTHLVGVD